MEGCFQYSMLKLLLLFILFFKGAYLECVFPSDCRTHTETLDDCQSEEICKDVNEIFIKTKDYQAKKDAMVEILEKKCTKQGTSCTNLVTKVLGTPEVGQFLPGVACSNETLKDAACVTSQRVCTSRLDVPLSQHCSQGFKTIHGLFEDKCSKMHNDGSTCRLLFSTYCMVEGFNHHMCRDKVTEVAPEELLPRLLLNCTTEHDGFHKGCSLLYERVNSDRLYYSLYRQICKDKDTRLHVCVKLQEIIRKDPEELKNECEKDDPSVGTDMCWEKKYGGTTRKIVGYVLIGVGVLIIIVGVALFFVLRKVAHDQSISSKRCTKSMDSTVFSSVMDSSIMNSEHPSVKAEPDPHHSQMGAIIEPEVNVKTKTLVETIDTEEKTRSPWRKTGGPEY